METLNKKTALLSPLDIRYNVRWFQNFYDTNICFKIYNSIIKPLTKLSHGIHKQCVFYEIDGKIKMKQLPCETSLTMKVLDYDVIFNYYIRENVFETIVCRGKQIIWMEKFEVSHPFLSSSKYKSMYGMANRSYTYYSIYNLGCKDGQEWSILATDVINKARLLEEAKTFEEKQKIINSKETTYDRDFKIYYKAYKTTIVTIEVKRDIDLGFKGVVRC